MDEKPEKPELVIIRGPPGSGKSLFATSYFVTKKGFVHASADQWMVTRHGKYHFDPENLEYAHSECLRKTKMNLKRGKSVVVDNTFRTNAEMEPYMNLDAEITVYRMADWYGTSKNIPKHVMKRHRKCTESVVKEKLVTYDNAKKEIVYVEK